MTSSILINYLIIINIVTFFIYGIDKYKAKKSKWRVSEKILITLAILGGSIGAWIGIKTWHHKTKHQKFKLGIPIIMVYKYVYGYICFSDRYRNLFLKQKTDVTKSDL